MRVHRVRMHSLLCPVLVVLLLGGPCPTAAFWTVDCGIVTIERSDPIVSPGTISAHTHVVAGSDTFGPSATNAILRQGTPFVLCRPGTWDIL